MTPDEFAVDFADAFTKSAFRLELLDTYIAANELEPFRRFQAHEPRDDAWREPWKRLVRAARQAGKRMERVHVVGEPLTDYMRFLLTWAYPANVEAGEDVRVLPRRIAETLDLPGQDYWLLDARHVALMGYDDQGNWLSVDLIDEPYIVANHIAGRDAALKRSIPLHAYLRENPGKAATCHRT
jgi:hypothetical protein